jgi:signal recognition particle subunit SRP54
LNKELIKEIKGIEKKIKPDFRILVMSADIGQAAREQAQEFKKALDIDGVIITKMDGSAKAGGALTACAEVNAGVFFIGVGEKIQDIEKFESSGFISRLLGMGDLNSLLEKVRSATSEKQQKRIEGRLKQGKFTLEDLYEQLKSMDNLGSFDKLIGMVPGLGEVKDKISDKDLKTQEKKMHHWRAAIDSMTKEEVENPEKKKKQTSRISRIAQGSGTTTSTIRELLKQYKLLNELMKSQDKIAEGKIDQKMMQKIAKQFKGKMKF